MANVDRQFGLRPVQHLDGAPYNGAIRLVYIPDTVSEDMFIGSPVKSTGDGDARGNPAVELGTPGDALYGVVVSFRVDGTDLEVQYRKGATEKYARVVEAPDGIFEVQASGDIQPSNIGDLADLTEEDGSEVSGISTVELDTTTLGSGTQVRVIGFVDREDNEPGENAKVLVQIVDHELK